MEEQGSTVKNRHIVEALQGADENLKKLEGAIDELSKGMDPVIMPLLGLTEKAPEGGEEKKTIRCPIASEISRISLAIYYSRIRFEKLAERIDI